MAQKERYEWSKPDQNGIFDNDTGETWNALELVREQETRIKALEDKAWYEKYIMQLTEQNARLLQENKQLKEQLQELLEAGKEMYRMLLNEHLYNKTNNNDAKNASQILERENEHLKFMRAMFSFKELLEDKEKKYTSSQNKIAIKELEKLKDVFRVKTTIDIYKGIVEVINEQIESLKGE